tara:strand:+ start:70 stop:540 length:471 start_codon:yes stop_codon:yes gene_type:complete
MNLFILRHGKAVNGEQDLKDFDRQLSEKGILQAIKIGDYLRDKNINQIICSSAPRAFETATIVDQIIKAADFEEDSRLYLADSNTIKHKISTTANANNVLYVGHNFGISDFASHISGQKIDMTTCMVIELDLQIDDWDLLSENIGVIKNITEPNQL